MNVFSIPIFRVWGISMSWMSMSVNCLCPRQTFFISIIITTIAIIIFLIIIITDLKFVTDITDYICGENSVMWRNFRFLFEQFMAFIQIYAVFVLNLCGEKSVWRKSLWRKNDKYEVCSIIFTIIIITNMTSSQSWPRHTLWCTWSEAPPPKKAARHQNLVHSLRKICFQVFHLLGSGALEGSDIEYCLNSSSRWCLIALSLTCQSCRGEACSRAWCRRCTNL